MQKIIRARESDKTINKDIYKTTIKFEAEQK